MYRQFLISFAALLVFISIYFAYTSISFSSDIIEALENEHISRLARFMIQNDNLLDARTLTKLKYIMKGEAFVYRVDGKLLASTTKKFPPTLQKLSSSILEEVYQGHIVTEKVLFNQKSYRFVLFYTHLNRDIACIVGFLLPTEFDKKVQKELIFGFSYMAFCGLVFSLVVSWLLTRWITAPLKQLVQVTKLMARGDLTVKAPEKGPPEIKQLAQALNEMASQLHEIQQKMIENERMAVAAQLASSMAHEIKNPLTSLRLAGELLVDLLRDQPELAKRAELIMQESKRLEDIIQNMLSQTKKLSLKRDQTDINQVITEVVGLAQYQIKKRGQKIRLLLTEKPLYTRGDKERLKQVLWNLLNNASEATPPGGEIIIRSQEDVEQDTVSFSVEDQGPGVLEEELSKLYKPFYTTKKHGTGLGLAIARQIVILHGGQIDFANRLEGGLRVTVTLPRLQG